MTDLNAATAIHPNGPGRYRALLSSDWEIWGPQGGYLATVAMRAAGAAMDRARPATIDVHFVGAGTSDWVDIEVETNRATRVGTSVGVRIVQGERLLLVGSVWGVDAELDGLEHQTSAVPDVPRPEALTSMAELIANQPSGHIHPFWANLEDRPTEWIEDWENRTPDEPSSHRWYRFTATETFDDPWLDAGRLLIVLDVDSWGATVRAHTNDLDHFAPTIQLTGRFIGDARTHPWLLSHAEAPVASNGLIAAAGRIWSEDDRLLAVGGSTLLCRPASRRPDR